MNHAEDDLEAPAAEIGERPAPPAPSAREVSWDTPAFDLLRAGLALKIRESGSDVRVSLSSLDRPGFSDLEIQRFERAGPVASPSRPLDPAGWPPLVRERVVALAGQAPELIELDDLFDRSIRIQAEMPMAEAGRLLWRRHLATMLSNEAGARRGHDIEYVHGMRVAIRRTRAVALLFGPFFRRRVLKGYLDAFRRTARTLGPIRDADVALLKLSAFAARRPAREQAGLSEIRAAWRLERRQAHRQLVAWLDSRAYRDFVTAFAALCRTPGRDARGRTEPAGGAPAPSLVGHVLPGAILSRFEQVRAYEPLMTGEEPVPVSTLHALRIDCKALRYSLEPVEPLLGPPGRKSIRQLRRVQDLLGDLQDAVVADARLADLADVAEPAALMSYRAHQQAVIARLRTAVPPAWRALVAPDNRRRIATAIARL